MKVVAHIGGDSEQAGGDVSATHISCQTNGSATANYCPPAATKQECNGCYDGKIQSSLSIVVLNMSVMSVRLRSWLLHYHDLWTNQKGITLLLSCRQSVSPKLT